MLLADAATIGSRNEIATQRMTAPDNPIQHSFELAAERCEDLTPLVYDRLFRQHPETRAMFRSEGSELVRGSMLALTIDAMLDFAGDRSGHFRMIECEVQSHDAYGTPRELFGKFFGVIAETVRELLETIGHPRSTRRGGNCSMKSTASSPAARRKSRPDVHRPARERASNFDGDRAQVAFALRM